jgi:eukaryotic-like serine/threonine-protein kinase
MEGEKIRFYEFREFLIDAQERLLFRDGETVSLTPKVFDTLLVFVENGGRMLTKGELMERLWANSFVEEANLTQNVSILRKVLGENLPEHRFIATVPGRGYRFVAPVRELSEETTHIIVREKTRTQIKIEETSQIRGGFPKIYLLAIITLMAVLGIGLSIPYLFHGTDQQTIQAIDSLAILPFTNTDGNAET